MHRASFAGTLNVTSLWYVLRSGSGAGFGEVQAPPRDDGQRSKRAAT